jgi:glycine cleavage system H protein
VGDSLEPGKEMGSVESVKAASDIYSPVAGKVIAVNEALESNPEKVNESPYDAGWMVRVRLGARPADLLDAAGYEDVVARESH